MDAQESSSKDVFENGKTASANVIHPQGQTAIASSSKPLSVTVSNCSSQETPQILLSTAIILVRDNQGFLRECRALLDSGSQSNFITKQFSELLCTKPQAINTKIVGISSSFIK